MYLSMKMDYLINKQILTNNICRLSIACMRITRFNSPSILAKKCAKIQVKRTQCYKSYTFIYLQPINAKDGSQFTLFRVDPIILSYFIPMEEDSPNRESSPQLNDSPQELEESFDFLVSKHLIPPPLMLLPKPVSHKPKSLTPMLPLPAFVGLIPNFQPLDKPIPLAKPDQDNLCNWIGEAFDRVVYRKYEEESYRKIDNVEENWNIWACDVSKMSGRKSTEEAVAASEVPLLPFYTPQSPNDRTLVFESRFECGNLSMASKVTDNEYNLLLQNDINTNGYSQWFFFKVSNTRSEMKVKFKLLNQYKINNLYKMGMKIIIYSKKESELKNLSWHRGGDNIEYYENGYSKSSTEYKPYFTLSWDYTFLHDDDDVYFAYSYPYTYSNLQNFFFKVESDNHLRNICQRTALCKTLAGNRVDILTITENHPYQNLDKGYILITARIHPGESVSSYVCNGIVEFLLSNHEKARKLRQNFIFKIIPMLNPDGVIHGNYRTNISGYDLNKKWQNPSKIYHPEIFYLKKLILSIQEISDVLLFCDLHGHSMKKNAFVYGCHDSANPRKGKEFPLLMSKIFKGFSFKDCSFLDKQQQEGTSRTFLAKELRHCDIYALQSSFCGPEHQNIHFTVRHFEELGQRFCEALLLYFTDHIKQMHIEAALRQDSHMPDRDDSFESLPQYEQLRNFAEIDQEKFSDRVNSEYSQMSEEEVEARNILDERVIKKYLMMRYMRPGTNNYKRGNINIRRSQSKQSGKLKLGDFLTNNKSNSPVKRRQLYETPVKPEKPKITLKFTYQKKQIQPKVFEPIDIIAFDRKLHHSAAKLTHETERAKLSEKHSDKPTIKIVLNKNFEFKEKKEEPQPIFKNTFLKNVAIDEPKQRKMSDFIIRKKNPYGDEKNTINLFNSVLSSLRKDKK